MSRILNSSQHSMRNNPTSTQCHGRPCFFWMYVFISGLLCLLQAGLVDAQDPYVCPDSCECTYKKDAIRKWINVTCDGVGLLQIPAQKKTGIEVLALNLTRNNITELSTDLQYFINLDSLDLSHNLISMLTSDSFTTLSNLITLNLSYNQITFLMSDVFANLTNLSTLSLEGNDLMYMSPAVFELQSLETLNLARNPNITFPPGVNPTESFTHFIISHCSLDTFPTNLLGSSENLRYLDMSHNSITSLSADVLSSNTKLEYLDISHNAITTIDKDFMRDNTGLLTLDLSYNKISDLDYRVFKKQQNLEYIDLSNNFLTTIDDKSFGECDNLKILDLSNNYIRDLDKDVFNNRDILESVDLSNNFLTTIDKDLFEDCDNLQSLNLNHNELTDLHRDTFKNLKNLQSVDLSNNVLTTIDEDLFDDCDNLQTLNLSNTQLGELDKDIFKYLELLQSIDLSSNYLTAIDKDWFDHCYNLRILDASDNSIESVDSDAFRDIQQLTHLDLSKNDITSIDAAMFNHIPGLQFLDLSYNDLTSIPVDVFTSLTGTFVLNITHMEDHLVCTCEGRNYLYTLKYDSRITLYDEDAIRCKNEDGVKMDYLDYYTTNCSGNIGWHGCNAATDCNARNSDCDDSQLCVCKKTYYDNNGDAVDGGICKPMVDLGYPCDSTAACLRPNSECDLVCKCKAGYFDWNMDTELSGNCTKTVELGETCRKVVDNSCAPEHSHCDATTEKCVCDSTHYDSNENEANGTCILKHLLDEACNASYQCAPENSECSEEGLCICSNDFYDIEEDKTSCQDIRLLFEQDKTQVERLNYPKWTSSYYQSLMSGHIRRRREETREIEGASSFFSCYLDETDGDDKPVEFSDLKTVADMDECKEYCFEKDLRHVTLETGTIINYCLCGSTKGSTITGCCPYVSGAASCTTTKKKAGDITYVTAELSLSPVPLLTTGKANMFMASAGLSLIDQIKWNFGDTEAEQTVDAKTSNYYHTYTRSGKYTITISACMKSAGVCDTVLVPVIAQNPSLNDTMWLTGYQKADVAKTITDMTATFTQGYDFEYTFSRTDSSGTTSYTQGCESGWVLHRQKCLKLYSTSSTYVFSMAQLMCSSRFTAIVLEINFEEEISEIATLLSLSTSSSSPDRVYINAEKQSSGAYRWLSNTRKVFFTSEHLDDPSLGNNVVIDASTGHLTSSDPNTKHKLVCMKDPGYCSYGGVDAGNGYCYKLSTTTKNWQAARDDCINSYGGRLANLKDRNIHGNVSSLLTGGITEAWIGLSDRSLEGYYLWSDDTSYDMNGAGSYKPTITSLVEDCFVVNDASTWNTISCYSVKRYVCEYSIRNQRLTVPAYLAGTNDIGITGNQNLVQVARTSSFTSSSGNKQVTLFPGMWTSRSGNIHSWTVRTMGTNIPGIKYNLALQVYRPHCLSPASPALVQPGCDNNMFTNCTASSLTCTSSSSCDDTEYFCYLSNQCKPFSEPCTCVSESGQQACQHGHSVSDAGPTYRLVGQTLVEVELLGERFLTIPADSVPVQEGDVLGFEIEAGKNVLKCENMPTSNLQQRSYEASTADWYMKDDEFPTASASDVDQTCYFHAIYTENIVKNLTTYLGSFDMTGTYSISIEIPSSGYSRTISTTVEEAVGDFKWVYPEVKEIATESTSLGTIYVEAGVTYSFTVRVGKGTSVSAAFAIDGTTSTENLHSACPADALAAIPSLCDTNLIWSDNPFSYFSHSISTTGTQNLTVTISNSISSETRIVTVKIAKPISNVGITCTSSPNNIVEVNDTSDFSTTVGDGTDLSYAYAIDGASVPGTVDTMTHTFSTVGQINVSVTVSNILGSSLASLLMNVILPANFQNCKFTLSEYTAAVNVSLTMSVTCEVALTAVVQASWSFSDRPLAAPLTSTETASTSTTVTWTQSVVFDTASSSVTVTVTYTDQINSGSISTSVTVYEAVPSVDLVAVPLKALVTENIDFTASVPPGIYGNLTFDFDFGNHATDSANATDSNPVAGVTYFYTNTGSYYVRVIATNGPSKAEFTIQVIVVEAIQGLTITSDSPTKTGELTTITVNVNRGSYGIVYNFVSYEASTATSTVFNINATQSSFSYAFPREGNYTVDVTAMNGLTNETGSVTVYVMDETTIYASNLEIDGGPFSNCIESNTEHEFDVSVIHFDETNLLYEYSFGDQDVPSGVSKVKHTYAYGNNFTLTLTIKYTLVPAAQVVLSETVCVQDPIGSPTIVVDQKIGLPPTGSVTKTASVSVTGTDPVYSWGTNASYTGSTMGSTFNLEFIATGFYSIDVNVSNTINMESAQTVVVEVLNAISGLSIACTNSSSQPCFDKAGHVYVEKGDTFTMSASVTSGDAVTYSWTFGDGSGPQTGQTVTKTYTNTDTYNVTVEARNDAGSELEYITVHAEERLTSVTLDKYLYGSPPAWIQTNEHITKKNEVTEFEAVEAPSGMEVEYLWDFGDGSTKTTTTGITGHNYTSTGHMQCEVTVKNFLNSVSKTFDFYVIETITSVNLKINGTEVSGTSLAVAVNRLNVFQIIANTDVKCSYMFSLKKNGKYVDSEPNYTWEYTFSTLGSYTLATTVTNNLGTEASTFNIEVIEEITNPEIKVTAGGPSITLGSSITLEASAQGYSPVFSWMYKQAPAGESLPSSTGQQLTLTPTSVGTFVVQLNASNDVSVAQTAEYTFVVMEAVAGVSIQSTLDPPDAVKINTLVTFTASVASGSDLSYAWTIESTTGSNSSFSYQFTAQKLYTVSVNVSNSASWIVETIQVYSLEEVPAFTLSVSGSTFHPAHQAAETGDTLVFSSSLSTTTFITFSWTQNAVSSGATTFSQAFPTPGSYGVALNASNKISFSVSQITVVIQDRISGLTVAQCSGTFAINTDIPLIATYNKGTNVTIDWDMESLPAASGDTTDINYPAPGTYAVNATATNFVSSEVVSCQIEIQGKIDNLIIDHSKYLFASFPVSFNVTGDYLGSASFSWSISGNPTPVVTSVPLWDYTFQTKGDYVVTVNVSNAVSSKEVSLNVTVLELECTVPTLTIADGITERTVTRARDIELPVTVSNAVCSAYTSINKWTLYIASSCSEPLTSEYSLPSDITTTTPSLNIPGKTLPYNTYCAVFEHSYKDTPVYSFTAFNLTIIESELVAIITGGDQKDVGAGTELFIDASESVDPDDTPGTTLSYTWGCQVTVGSSDVCSAVGAVTSVSANLTGITLTDGDVYVITVTVSAPGRTSSTTSQTLRVTSAGSPEVSISCISCKASGYYCVSGSRSVKLRGTCTSGCDDTTTYLWTVSPAVDESHTATKFHQKNLVIKPRGLQDGVNYTFTLTATSGGKSGTVSITMTACSVPHSGTCLVHPTTMVLLSDLVTVECSGMKDDRPNVVFRYKVVIQNYDDASEEYTAYDGTSAKIQTYVSPWPGSDKVFMFVYVRNDVGSGIKFAAPVVTFTSPVLSPGITMTDFIVSHVQANMMAISQQNDPVAIMQYAAAILNTLNEQARLADLADDQTEVANRTAVRDLFAVVLEGLPISTTYQIQLMAKVAEFLTAYKEEIQVSSTLDSACDLVKTLTTALSKNVIQGMEQTDLQPNSLLKAQSKVSSAYLHGSSGGTSSASTLFGNLESYVPPISVKPQSVTYSSEEERKQIRLAEIWSAANDAIKVPLLTMLADQEDFSFHSGSMIVLAHRPSIGNIWRSKNANGFNIQVPSDILSHANYHKDDVLQIIRVNTEENPLGFNQIPGAPVSTIVADAVFMSSDNGDEISVNNLPDDKFIGMYIFNKNVPPYDVDTNLINATSYDPFSNTNGTTWYLEANSIVEAAISRVHQDAAGIHIQIKVEFFGCAGKLSTKLYKDDVPLTDADGEGVAPREINQDMMTGTGSQLDHRQFTFFDKAGTSESAYKVEVSSETCNVNVTVSVYYSLCMFYNPVPSAWDTEGCEPTDESIADCIACNCNHMTSYGGSVLLSPDQIVFTDITHIDISANPVAIITCSIILGLYIVIVIVCKRLDIMDVQRISTIPLCGKDGSFKYEVTMVTGRQIGAGTTANVGCRIIGEYGKSASQHLNKKGAFKRNCSDSFIMAYDVNLGEIKKVLVWHDNRGTSPSWYLDHVIIKDLQTEKKYYFLCTSWLTLEEEKGSIQKELKAATSSDMKKFGRQMKTATYNSLADKHLWLSLMNRPAQSRFTRVQRATCCVTLLYTFIAVNAMWYGLVKKNNSASIVGDFGWEEVVVGLISNLMVFPINIGIIFLFKKSRSKSTLFDHGRKPQTAETIEIENLCDNSQSGSFQSSAYGGVPIDLERESTMESLPRNATATALHRSRHVKSQRDDADTQPKKPLISATSASAKGPMWNQDSIMKWPEKMPYSEDGDLSRPSTGSTTVTQVKQATGKSGPQRKTIAPGTAESDELLKYLDEMENDLKDSEERSAKGSAGRKPSRKPSVGTSRWGSLEDILNSDDESAITDNSKKKLKKKSSTTSQASSDKKFNPRDDPKLNGNSRWLKSRESNASGSMIGGEHFYYSRGHISSEAGITAGLKPGYSSQMTMNTQDLPALPDSREKCTLPSWCIYIAYILCFLLSAFSIVLVILYCFKFGYEESLEWVLALIFALFQSFLLIEPVKAVFIAVYMVLILKKVEQDEDEDCIDIEPTFDNSSEMIKDVKFKPISGFALMQAKEEGQKMHRMKVMLRQFIAYIFYLWLLMVIVYVNFPYDTYLLTKHVENSFVHGDDTNGSVVFNNISSIEDFWDWTENTFADAVHLQDSNSDEEHGFLLGVARMRLIRSTTVTCEPAASADRLGASSLTDRTCYGYLGFEEDTETYGEGWNDSYYNYSWKHSSGNELGGGHKVGHVATYGGGGYAHNLGTTLSQTQTVIQDLRSKDWVDLRTRAVILELAIYSPGTDMTALVAMLVEFPLTGSAIASYEIQTQKLLWFQEGRVDPLMICEVILLLVTVYSLVHIVVSIRDTGKSFFKDFWNWYEMLTTLMTMVAIGMYLGCVVEATNTFNHLLADKTGFTNFERVMYVHVGMRYLHAWLLFLLMYKVVKQLRFIKFMHIYEKTISTAVGQLLAVGLIFIILLLIYAQVGYLMYGQIPGFDSVGHAIVTLIVMIRGTFDFWPMLDYQPVFSHFYVYSYYAFTYGLTIALVIAILNNMYRRNRSQMYYKATLDMQDYEMIDFMMKRFKLWAGIQKEKPAFRRVKFQGLPSISSRSSSSYTNQTSSSSSHQSSTVMGPEYSRAQLNSMMNRLGPTWLACVKRFDRILDLDKEEDTLVKKAESEVKEINLRLRVNDLGSEKRELLNWNKTDKPPDQNQRQSTVKTNTNKDTKSDTKKSPATLTFASRTSGTPPATSVKAEGSQMKGKRPLSDQGARIDIPAKGKSSAAEPKSLQKFFQQVKPSKPAWNNNKT